MLESWKTGDNFSMGRSVLWCPEKIDIIPVHLEFHAFQVGHIFTAHVQSDLLVTFCGYHYYEHMFKFSQTGDYRNR